MTDNVDNLKKEIERLEMHVSVLETLIRRLTKTEPKDTEYLILFIHHGTGGSALFPDKVTAQQYLDQNPALWAGNYLMLSTKEWDKFRKELRTSWDVWEV